MESSLSSNTPVRWIISSDYGEGPMTWRSSVTCPRAHVGHGRAWTGIWCFWGCLLSALSTRAGSFIKHPIEEVLDLNSYHPESQFWKVEMQMRELGQQSSWALLSWGRPRDLLLCSGPCLLQGCSCPSWLVSVHTLPLSLAELIPFHTCVPCWDWSPVLIPSLLG